MNAEPDTGLVHRRFGEQPLLFELIPPPTSAGEDLHDRRRRLLQELFERVDVAGVNLPEIQEESQKNKKGNRRSNFKQRETPRDYARELSAFLDAEFVLNRVIVKRPGAEQERWMIETHRDYGRHNLVLVGGESSSETYPGPSVPDGNRLVKEYLNRGKRRFSTQTLEEPTEFLVGNIAISTRRRQDFDEPERMLVKIRSGADFFTTQIVAEPDSPLSLTRDLGRLLHREGTTPPPLFWSFSPIAQKKDVDFMRWLGVSIPDDVEERVLSSSDPAATSIEWARDIWRQLQELNQSLPVSFPLGLNISFMGMRNFENAIDLAETLREATVPQRVDESTSQQV